MHSIRVRKALRDLWLHKSRSILVIAAICIGIIGAGAVLDAWSLVRAATRLGYDASRPPAIVIRADSVPSSLLARVAAMPEVESVVARRAVTATVRTAGGSFTALIAASSDFTTTKIGVIEPLRGEWPPATGLVVETSSVDFAQLALGDSVLVAVGDSAPRRVAITGVARDVGVAPGWMEHLVYLFASPEELRRLGAPATLNELHVRVKDHSLSRADIATIADRVRAVAVSSGTQVTAVTVPVPGRHIHAAQIDSLLFTQGAFAVLTLLLSALLVVNLISAMLTGQVREIGVMKAIGGSTSQIASMYLLLALCLGALSSLISIPVAMLLGRAYAEFTGSLLNFDTRAVSIPRWAIALQLVVGLTLPVLAAAIPVFRGCRIAVGDALRDVGIDSTAGGGSAFLAGFGGLSRPLLLSLRNAFRKRQRLVLTLTTLSIGGAIFLGAINLRQGVSGAVGLLFAPQHFDVSYRFATPHAPDSLLAAVRSMSDVTAAEAWSGARAVIDRGDGRIDAAFSITAPPAATTLLSVPLARGTWVSSTDRNELVVGTQLLVENPSLALGSVVRLRIAGTVSEWTVVGIAESGPTPMAYAAREVLDRLRGAPSATATVVAIGSGSVSSRLETVRHIREDLADRGFDVSSSQSVAQQRAVMEDHLLMVASFLGDMSLLMIVVGGLGLASTMSLSVLERTREIGVLRAIGAPHRAIVGMIQVEGLVIAVLSWIVAVPLSLPMSVLLGKAFSRVMLQVPVSLVPEVGGLLRWLGVVVAVSLVACTWPAIRATRITTAAALAWE